MKVTFKQLTRWSMILTLVAFLVPALGNLSILAKEKKMTVTAPEGYETTPTGLSYQDEPVGTGTEAMPGKKVTVHYTGTLYPGGQKFDSSRDRNQPFSFVLGQGRVIAGWEEGIQGMKVGGQRTLIIPAKLGYGDRGAPPVIPGNSTLKFEVELLGVD